MWDSFRDLLNRNPEHRFTKVLLRAGLSQALLAIDYLHSECRLVHTGEFFFVLRLCYTNASKDIKAENILIEIDDHEILDSFVNGELESPSPRKIVDGAPVYGSRRFDLPKKFGLVVLSDFGEAVSGDQKRTHDAQSNVYRCPEVMLKTEWSYPADIWNVGAMVGLLLCSNRSESDRKCRFGTSLRISTCFMETIRMVAAIKLEPIWQKWLDCWDHLR
jgi:serine/threonine-protein kinase SRPK3